MPPADPPTHPSAAERRLHVLAGHLGGRAQQTGAWVPPTAAPSAAAGAGHPGAAGALLRPRGAVAPGDIIFGCSPIGPRISAAPVSGSGDVANGPGDTRKALAETESATPAIHAALRAGLRIFDTAPLYGACEDRLGEALGSSPLGAEAAVVTKSVASAPPPCWLLGLRPAVSPA